MNSMLIEFGLFVIAIWFGLFIFERDDGSIPVINRILGVACCLFLAIIAFIFANAIVIR